jgi:hypothetical protein
MERKKRRVKPSRIQKKLGSNWNTSNSNIMYGTDQWWADIWIFQISALDIKNDIQWISLGPR